MFQSCPMGSSRYISLQSQKLHTSRMKRTDPQSICDFPSLFSQSRLPLELGAESELSLRYLYEDEKPYLDLNRLNSSPENEKSAKRELEFLAEPELKRCTSFETLLMENHRNVMVESIRDYFQRIGHPIVRKVRTNELKSSHPVTDEVEILKKEELLESIISERKELSQEMKQKLITTLRENLNEVMIAEETIRFCPTEMQYEVIYLIGVIFLECEQVVEHFKRRDYKRELEERSHELAKTLLSETTLKEMFVSPSLSETDILKHFDLLVEKWMITLFLMKVGVFDNDLQELGAEKCLDSQALSEISLNDLLNQHLVRPGKRVKRE